MDKTLIKHGHSWALVIDKPILELLQITADTLLELTTNGDAILITPIRDKLRQRYGGDPGVRDVGLLESALAQPRVAFGGKTPHAFPFEMAAAYLFHIVQNHPFVDGNIRTGAVAALLFLDLSCFSI